MAEEQAEVERVVEAIEALDAIEDDADCAAAVSRLLERWPDHHARLREIRQRRVQALKAEGRTWAEVGQVLGGVSAARAQQIAVGHRGAKRPVKDGGAAE
ncbi:hypothetical protein [Streptomyces sp. NPDC090026]|uniref:hypothetical protein n=1 Tax=Streptomyces sp. NPDC090026 TaxID=3365923 RepID=UPI0038200C0F